jgi:hypothetical protein
MTDKLESVLNNLIQISRQIMLELQSDEPSLADIGMLMESRQAPIRELDSLSAGLKSDNLTPSAKDKLRAMFAEFLELNENVLNILNRMRQAQSAVMENARTHRRAEQLYHGAGQEKLAYQSDFSYYK